MKACQKKQSAHHQSLFGASLPLRRALNLAILTALYPAFAYANPDGAQIVSGQVSIDTATPGVTTVTNSPNAIINWQNFSIGQNELTQFIQQNGQSAVLNRIIGQNPSEILGQLTSNGKVFLINPNGIVFGAGSAIDTQGLIASSLNLSDQDFLSGNYHFMAGSSAGNILNEGIIRAGKDGNIILIAPHIENNGIIKSDGGSITLAAGQELTITNLDNPDIRFQIQAPADSILNLGKLLTEGGAINVFANTIKHSGEINADSVQVDKQGHIQLIAQQDITLTAGSKISTNNSQGDAGTIHIDSKTGTTLAYGTIEAQASQTGSSTQLTTGKGGKIELLGEHVGVLDQAKIDASGQNGGGQVLIGGDYQGKNPDVHNAKASYVGKDTTIKADAKTNGDGGKIIVWSDNTTRVYGNISAKGGTNSGNGGFVETSGHNYLDFQGLVNTWAPHGKDGTLLLDPSDITIDNSSNSLGGGSFNTGIFSGATGNSILTWATINAQSGNLSIKTSTATSGNGDININASGTVTGPSTLTLLANRNINFANGVSVSSSGSRDFNLIAGWNNTGWAVNTAIGNITFGTNSSLSTSGNVWLNAGNSITGGTTSAITANTLSIGNTNGGSLPGGVSLLGNNMVNTLAAQIDSSTGSLTFNNGQTLTIGSGNYFNGIVATGNTNPINITTTAGNISVNQNITSASSVSLTSSQGAIAEAGGVINTTGLLTTNSKLGTLLNGANTIGSFHATNSTSGNIALTNTATNLTLTGISNSAANGNVTVNNTNMITNSGAISASNVSLKAGKMALASGTISGSSSISLLTTNAIDISTGATDNLSNTLELSNSELNTITTPILRIGDISSGAIDIKSAPTLTKISSALNLTSGGAITQQTGATISVPALSASGSSVKLTNANPVGVISGMTTAGNFQYNSSNWLTVSTVDGVSGITVPFANDIRLKSYMGINQQTGANLVGGGLGLTTTGPVWFPNPGNNISNIAADLSVGGLGTGAFSFFSNSNLTVSSILSTDATTTKIDGITTNNQKIDITSKALSINSVINAGTQTADLTTDTLTWDSVGNGKVIGSDVGIQQITTGRPITIGAACIGGPGTCLSITELWRISASVIGIGYENNAGIHNSGDIYVSGITLGSSTLSDRNAITTRIGLLSGGSITQSATPINVYDLGIEANGAVTLTAANNITNLAAKILGSNLTFNNGKGFDIIQMTGSTASSNANYNINGINTCSALGSCGNVSLTTTSGDLNIPTQINAGTGNVNLKAANGSIYGSGTSPDIIAGVLDISAYNSIFGLGGLQTQVSRINSLNATNGLIDILNFGGVILGPSTANSATTSINAAGNVTVTAHSPLTMNGGVASTTGSINLTASNNDVLSINAPLTVSNASVITLAGGTLTGSYAGSYAQYFNNATPASPSGGSTDSTIINNKTLSETVTTSTQTTTSGVLGTTTQLGNPLADNSSSNSDSTGGASSSTAKEDNKTDKQCTK